MGVTKLELGNEKKSRRLAALAVFSGQCVSVQ